MRENAHPLYFKRNKNCNGKLEIEPSKAIKQMRDKTAYTVYGNTRATLRKGLLNRISNIYVPETGETLSVFFLSKFLYYEPSVPLSFNCVSAKPIDMVTGRYIVSRIGFVLF